MAGARKKPAEYNQSMAAVRTIKAAAGGAKFAKNLPTEEEWTKRMQAQGRTVVKKLAGGATATEKLGG